MIEIKPNEWFIEKIKEIDIQVNERRCNTMSTIKEQAKNYISKQTKNVAELKQVSVDLPILEGKAKDKDGKEFTYNYIEVEGEEYRVPDKVLKDLKAIFEKKPALKTFSVSKQGSGLNTQYTVIPLD